MPSSLAIGFIQPNEEAAAFIRSKPIVSQQVFKTLLPELRARAFAIGGIEAANVLQTVRNEIATLPEGALWDDVKANIADAMEPYLGDQADRRAELLIRTHGFQAYQAGKWQAGMANDNTVAWQYLTMEDARVRPSHAALEGVIMPKHSAFWRDHFPPWDWGCRCRVVALSADDVADERAADQDRIPDNRFVLEGPLAKNLEQGTLIRNGRAYDLTPPSAKPGAETAFQWNPGDLRIPLEQLKARYDPEVWAAFEEFAKDTEIGDGISLYDWLDGEELHRVKAAGHPGREAGPRVTPVDFPPRQSPISNVLRVSPNAKLADALFGTLTVIASVHDEGGLPAIPIVETRGTRNVGAYAYDRRTGVAHRIEVSRRGSYPELIALHEIAHLIDHQRLISPGTFASGTEVMADFRRAIEATQTYKLLQKAVERERVPVHGSDGRLRWKSLRSSERQDLRRLIDADELWARAYAQYIVSRTGNPVLAGQLAADHADYWHLSYWSDDEFAPIAKEIDKLFRGIGWL